MSLKDKVIKLRNEFKKSHIFEVNNPAIADKQYFGIFTDKNGQLNYDFSDSEMELFKLKKQRIKSGITKNYSVLSNSEFIKVWFDYQFWLFCLNFSNSSAEEEHYKYKINKITNDLFIF